MNIFNRIRKAAFKVKQFFKPLAVAAAAVAIVCTANAQQKVAGSFINGSYLNIPPQSTNCTPAVGNFASTNSWTYAKSFMATNVPVTITNPANGLIINGYISQYVPLYVTNGAAFSDVDLWANQDGSIPLTGLVVVYTSADGTNTTISPVFTLTPIAVSSDLTIPGLPTVVETNVQDTFQFTGPSLQATNVIALETNLPTAFLQGEQRLRLTITNPNNGTNGAITILGIWLKGFRPQPSL